MSKRKNNIPHGTASSSLIPYKYLLFIGDAKETWRQIQLSSLESWILCGNTFSRGRVHGTVGQEDNNAYQSWSSMEGESV